MATLTVNTTKHIHEVSGQTGGDIYVIDAGSLIVDSDTRWHELAPASMTGTFARFAISSAIGGSVLIDGTKVRWIPYDTGTGNVPAIGTTITQGSVTGVLLGVWASYTSAPTAVGAAMPASGYLKFRSVTGGTFTTGALTGIGANATSADVVGWLEIVGDQTSAQTSYITVPRLGSFTATGAWFELGTTTGSAHQLVQVPTNGGGGYVPGVWIENAPGSGIYDYYTGYSVSTLKYSTTQFGTDLRSKVVEILSTGQIRIGGDGTNLIGNLPASGCKIRIPNLFCRQALVASRATNANPDVSPTYKPYFVSNNGQVSLDKISCDWYNRHIAAYNLTITNSSFMNVLEIQQTAKTTTVDNVGLGFYGPNYTNLSYGFYVYSTFGPTSVSNSTFSYPLSTDNRYAGYFVRAYQLTVNNVIGFTADTAAGSSYTAGAALGFLYCDQAAISNIYALRHKVIMYYCTSSTITNMDYCSNYSTPIVTSSGMLGLASCTDCTVNGITIGFNGTYSNCHPYTEFVYMNTTIGCRVRNMGTKANPVVIGATANTGYLINESGLSFDNKIDRMYTSGTFRSGVLGSTNISARNRYTSCWAYSTTQNTSLANSDTYIKNAHMTDRTDQTSSVYGFHFYDHYTGLTSDTTGRLVWVGHEDSTTTDPYVTVLAGNPRFTSTGNLTFTSIGDQIMIETPYWVRGYTAFANSALVHGTNIPSVTMEYDIDTGAGFTGTYKNLRTTANLVAEDISDYETGFRFRIRFTATANDATGATSAKYVGIPLTTSSTAKGYQWPLETPAISYTNVVANTKLAVFRDSDDALMDIKPEATGTVTAYPEWNADYNAVLRLRSPGYEAQQISITIDYDGVTIPTAQLDYPTIGNTDPGALSVTVTNHGATPITVEGKVFSISIQVSSDLITAEQIANYVAWNISQDATWNGFHGFKWPEMVIPSGTEYETAYGRLFGSVGAVNKGVVVLKADGVTPHQGFTRMQADDGTYYVRPDVGTITSPNLLTGSRVQLYNVTTATEISNAVLASPGFSYSYTDGTTFTTGDTYRFRVTKLGYLEIEVVGVVTSTGAGMLDTQVVDSIYATNAIDGSTCTEFSLDQGNVQIDIDDPDGETTVKRLYAYYSYLITTAVGIDFALGGMTAIDEVNYRINASILDWKLDNVSGSTVRVSDGYLFRSDGAHTVVAVTTLGSLILDPDKAYISNSNNLALESSVQTAIAVSV